MQIKITSRDTSKVHWWYMKEEAKENRGSKNLELLWYWYTS